MKTVTTMEYQLYEGVLVVVHGSLPPTDTEWNEFFDYCVARMKADQVQQDSILVVTDGGGPNATQRAKTNDLVRGRVVRIAVCSDSLSARAIINASALFNRHIHAFPKSQIPRALDHLQVAPHVRARILREIPSMQERLAQSGAVIAR
jgi:hypothetical protein